MKVVTVTDYHSVIPMESFEQLAHKCDVFAQDWSIQQEAGLSEERWFLWSTLLTHAQGVTTGLSFSEASHKHNERSVQRIEDVSQKQKMYIRCTTFGCDEEQVKRCFKGKVKTNKAGQMTNTPALLLNSVSSGKKQISSGNPILEAIGIYINEQGNRIESINGNLFAGEILSKIQLMFTHDERFFEYAGTVWKYLDANHLSRKLRDFLHNYVPNSWAKYLEYSYIETLKLAAPRYDELNIDRSIINLKNTMLDLNTYQPIKHDPKYLSTVQVPIDYDPNATCPLFIQTLNQLFDGDQERINLLAEIFGYCLTSDVEAQKAFILYGPGSNGKSTIIDLIPLLCGKENVSFVPLDDLTNGFSRSLLYEKLVNINTENEFSKKGLNTQYLKAISSGDSIMADRKYKSQFNFNPFCKLVFAMNNLPYSQDKSYGFTRRLIIIPFTKIFTKANADINLKRKLGTELQGIFNFAIEGLKRLRKNGYQFTKSKLAEHTLSEYKRDLNPIYTFIDDCLIPDPNGFVKSAVLHERFTDWCKQEGHHLLGNITKNHLPQKLVPALAELKVPAEIIRKKDRGITGIRIRTSSVTSGTALDEANHQLIEALHGKEEEI